MNLERSSADDANYWTAIGEAFECSLAQPDEVGLYQGRDRRRLSMRPGLTCLWQISGRNQIDFEDWMRLDRKYIDTWSLVNDVAILIKTVPVILLRKGAS